MDSHQFVISIGEESYSSGTRNELTDEPTYCVDPIGKANLYSSRWYLICDLPDGTTNFVHGFPFACISLGLIYQKRPVLGVIYNPFLDHLVCSTILSDIGGDCLLSYQVHRN